MTGRRMVRIAAIVSSAVVLAGAFATPAAARKGCGKFKPSEPASASGQTGEALEAKIVKVTDKATEKKPITIEFHQDSGAWHPDGSEPMVDNSTFFNFQVVSKKKLALLNLRADWGYPTASDLDYYLFDGTGNEIGSSTAFNPLPAVNQSTGRRGVRVHRGHAGASLRRLHAREPAVLQPHRGGRHAHRVARLIGRVVSLPRRA
ncbi:MAG: hypothetical protein ACRDKB_01950 [Actinomycetota bacterium]